MNVLDYLSLIDFLIVGLIGYASWRGYKRGALMEAFSFATIIVGVYLASRFSDGTAGLLSSRANGKDFSYLPVLLFAVLFGGLIYLSIIVQSTVGKQVSDLEKTKASLILGAVFGGLHMFLIIGVVSVMIKAADYNFRVMPDRERTASSLFKPVVIIMTGLFPSLDYVGEVDEEKVQKENKETDQTQKVIDE